MFLLAETAKNTAADTWADKVWKLVQNLLGPILIVACAVGIIYAIVLGINMMKAESKEKRDEAKARLINVAIAIVATAVMIGLFYALKGWLGDSNNENPDNWGLWSNVNPLMNTVNLVKQCARMIVFKC